MATRVRCLVRISGPDRTYEIGEEMVLLDRLAAHHVSVGNAEHIRPLLAETAPELPVLGEQPASAAPALDAGHDNRRSRRGAR